MAASWRRWFNTEPLKANKKATAAVAFLCCRFMALTFDGREG